MAKQKATDYKRSFNEQNYDRLAITIPKGQKATVQGIAVQTGDSINGYVNKAVQDRMEALLMDIIRDEGKPIGFTALAEKSGLSTQDMRKIVEELSRKKLVYTIFSLPTAPDEFSVSLMQRAEYWKAPFHSDVDKRIFVLLKTEGDLTLGGICSKASLSNQEALESILRLTAQKRIRISLGCALMPGEPVPGMTFSADPEAVKHIVI